MSESHESKALYNAISYLESIGEWNSLTPEINAVRLRQAREAIVYLEDRNNAILENRPVIKRSQDIKLTPSEVCRGGVIWNPKTNVTLPKPGGSGGKSK